MVHAFRLICNGLTLNSLHHPKSIYTAQFVQQINPRYTCINRQDTDRILRHVYLRPLHEPTEFDWWVFSMVFVLTNNNPGEVWVYRRFSSLLNSLEQRVEETTSKTYIWSDWCLLHVNPTAGRRSSQRWEKSPWLAPAGGKYAYCEYGPPFTWSEVYNESVNFGGYTSNWFEMRT